MSEDRLNGLAMMQYHHDIPLEPEEVVEEFVRCNPRRLELVNPHTMHNNYTSYLHLYFCTNQIFICESMQWSIHAIEPAISILMLR